MQTFETRKNSLGGKLVHYSTERPINIYSLIDRINDIDWLDSVNEKRMKITSIKVNIETILASVLIYSVRAF